MEPNRSEPVIRDAVATDADAVAGIWSAGWRDGHLGHVPQELVAARTERSFVERATERVGGTRVAELGGEVAGFVMVVDDEVEQVYVSGRHRGAGVADLLMADAEAQVRDAGHATAWLAVVAGNARARRFYQRRGWVDAGLFEYRAAGSDGPLIVPCHRYERQLGDAG